jgi:hypothetical protein
MRVACDQIDDVLEGVCAAHSDNLLLSGKSTPNR